MAMKKGKYPPPPVGADKGKKAQSRRMNAQAARTKLGALSNKPVKNPRGGMWASPSVQKQAFNVAQTQKAMYPGTKFKGYTTVKPGRADAKPSPKKSKNKY